MAGPKVLLNEPLDQWRDAWLQTVYLDQWRVYRPYFAAEKMHKARQENRRPSEFLEWIRREGAGIVN